MHIQKLHSCLKGNMAIIYVQYSQWERGGEQEREKKKRKGEYETESTYTQVV